MAARALDCFADVVAGLEDLAAAELAELGATAVVPGAGGLRFRHGRPDDLAAAGLLAAVYRELRFDVARPKALLGDAALRRLMATVTAASRGVVPVMTRFRLSAAGSDTPVFRRLAAAIEAATGLREHADGELLVRVRPFRGTSHGEEVGGGWEALVRLTPRPLSTRPWRVCNRPGGLNATVAVALNELLAAGTRPGGGTYLNLMCGSGTLLVERALAGPGTLLVGVDVDEAATLCSATNLAAAGVAGRAELVVGDVTDGGLAARLAALAAERRAPGRGGLEQYDAIAVDAPWGDAVGTHAANEQLHAAVTSVARALLAPGGRFGIVSHEVRLVARTLEHDPDWRVVSRRQVAHGGHNPVMLVLERAVHGERSIAVDGAVRARPTRAGDAGTSC